MAAILLRHSAARVLRSTAGTAISGQVTGAAPAALLQRCMQLRWLAVTHTADGDASTTGAGPGAGRLEADAARPFLHDAEGATVNKKETRKFAEVADHWWDQESGPFAALHTMSGVRCSFIRSVVCAHFQLDTHTPEPFTGLRMLDVGCGGGLLSEPLARMGATVTGVDAVAHSVNVAAEHAHRDPVVDARVTYRAVTSETLVQEGHLYDVVCSLEVMEHVNDLEGFVQSLAALTRPGGVVVLSTLNRTVKSYAMAILGAEYILRWVPAGTHDWSKFITPEELALLSANAGLELKQLTGMVYNPLHPRSWTLDDTDVDLNYIAYAIKPT